jgi:NaMN:DMB phosphoribosyltransferase
MIPLCAGIGMGYGNRLVLAGGTQMLAVAALMKSLSIPLPLIATTVYVRDDPSANFSELASRIGVPVAYVDPGFGDLGHAGLARYCIGEVKEGMGAGGAMFLAAAMGHSPDDIRKKILGTVSVYQ